MRKPSRFSVNNAIHVDRSLAHSHAIEEESVVGLIRAVLVGGGHRTKWKMPKPALEPTANSTLWQEQRGPWESVLTISDDLCRRLDLSVSAPMFLLTIPRR